MSPKAIYIKSSQELEIMREAGRILSKLLKFLEKQVKPGITTQDLDVVAENFIREQGAIPAFKGYYGFPASICTSVNEEVVHGIPSKKILNEGDIVSVDAGVKLNGFYSDAARTFPVGNIDAESRKLLEVTRKALYAGIDEAVEGNHLSDISAAVQSCAEEGGYGIVREYVGHGIGRELHEEPQVPNYGPPHQGPELKYGMVLAIEPMLNLGTHKVEVLKDGWTVVTKDQKRSGHFEQTIFVGKDKPEVVTE